jgi:hypothetical protein
VTAAAHKPAAETPPPLPSFGGETWRCPGREGRRCTQVLGIVYRGWLYQSYKGRRTTSRLPARVQCEHCGNVSAKGG